MIKPEPFRALDASPYSRRRFLQVSAVAGIGSGLASLGRALAADGGGAGGLDPARVQFRPEIEPVVRWIEDTPRERILEEAVARMRRGLSYRDLMAGLFLAGIRNIQPRPVGFKFHAVMVIHSAHQLGQTAPVDEWLIPMLWALDTFKASQEQDVREGDWTLRPADESRLPEPAAAAQTFHRAMQDWDAAGADAATSALCRACGASAVMEAFWPYAMRDQRNIGHKAIFAAQAFRTLQTIGWQHAEPVLRSLAYGLLDRGRKDDGAVVGPYAENRELAESFPAAWLSGRRDRTAGAELLAELRTTSSKAAGACVLNCVRAGLAPESIWDTLLKSANELLLHRPGIIALHAVTSLHALHTLFTTAAGDENRRLALLQAAAWAALFREAHGGVAPPALDRLEPLDVAAAPEEALADIFATIGTSRGDAARKTLAYLDRGGDPETVFAAARRMVFLKASDSHDFKFCAAAWEEALLAAEPRTRALLVAGMMGNLPGSATRDSALMQRARAAATNPAGVAR